MLIAVLPVLPWPSLSENTSPTNGITPRRPAVQRLLICSPARDEHISASFLCQRGQVIPERRSDQRLALQAAMRSHVVEHAVILEHAKGMLTVTCFTSAMVSNF